MFQKQGWVSSGTCVLPSFLLARPVFALCVNPQPAEGVHTLPAISLWSDHNFSYCSSPDSSHLSHILFFICTFHYTYVLLPLGLLFKSKDHILRITTTCAAQCLLAIGFQRCSLMDMVVVILLLRRASSSAVTFFKVNFLNSQFIWKPDWKVNPEI